MSHENRAKNKNMNDPPEKNVSFVSQPLKPQVHGLIQIPISLNGNPIQNDEKSLLCIISSPRPKRKTDLQNCQESWESNKR